MPDRAAPSGAAFCFGGWFAKGDDRRSARIGQNHAGAGAGQGLGPSAFSYGSDPLAARLGSARSCRENPPVPCHRSPPTLDVRGQLFRDKCQSAGAGGSVDLDRPAGRTADAACSLAQSVWIGPKPRGPARGLPRTSGARGVGVLSLCLANAPNRAGQFGKACRWGRRTGQGPPSEVAGRGAGLSCKSTLTIGAGPFRGHPPCRVSNGRWDNAQLCGRRSGLGTRRSTLPPESAPRTVVLCPTGIAASVRRG